jgi:integrase
MLVVKNWRPSMSEEFNYYDMKGRRFIFNQYKTAKRYGQQIEDLPSELVDALNLYVKFHPLRKQASFPLLVNYMGEELHPVNGITRALNKIFGKNLGSSMLRHIFLTEKYGGSKVDEKEEDARKMAHSVAVQQAIYVKK